MEMFVKSMQIEHKGKEIHIVVGDTWKSKRSNKSFCLLDISFNVYDVVSFCTVTLKEWHNNRINKREMSIKNLIGHYNKQINLFSSIIPAKENNIRI